MRFSEVRRAAGGAPCPGAPRALCALRTLHPGRHGRPGSPDKRVAAGAGARLRTCKRGSAAARRGRRAAGARARRGSQRRRRSWLTRPSCCWRRRARRWRASRRRRACRRGPAQPAARVLQAAGPPLPLAAPACPGVRAPGRVRLLARSVLRTPWCLWRVSSVCAAPPARHSTVLHILMVGGAGATERICAPTNDLQSLSRCLPLALGCGPQGRAALKRLSCRASSDWTNTF